MTNVRILKLTKAASINLVADGYDKVESGKYVKVIGSNKEIILDGVLLNKKLNPVKEVVAPKEVVKVEVTKDERPKPSKKVETKGTKRD